MEFCAAICCKMELIGISSHRWVSRFIWVNLRFICKERRGKDWELVLVRRGRIKIKCSEIYDGVNFFIIYAFLIA